MYHQKQASFFPNVMTEDTPPSPLPLTPSKESYLPLTKWLLSGQSLADKAEERASDQHPWYLVMWLTGVDYFSSIAYQSGIALLAAGFLAPMATAILVVVTLCCAVPVYREVARYSYAGQGSIAMLEHLVSGWWKKILVIVLLGFAGTDFVITMTLSAADSAKHAVENPVLKPYVGHLHLAITLGLLFVLAAVFLRGFKDAIALATGVAIPYVILNVLVIARCAAEIFRHPDLVAHWRNALHGGGQTWVGIFMASALVFPRLALGLSGFETGVSVMPLIRGGEDEGGVPKKRIENTSKLLVAIALLMSALLLSSSFVTALLIPEQAYKAGGAASGRAMAYLAHQYLGNVFGSAYDLSTILILWFAGASAMAGLLNLVPRYLPRFGMAPQWATLTRPLVFVLFAIDVVVTLVFGADVDRQGGAYATGVLVLIFSAAIAVALTTGGKKGDSQSAATRARGKAFYFWGCAAVFGYTLVANVIERPDGIIIASIFIVLLILTSVVSRYFRSTELRVQKCDFADEESEALWNRLNDGHMTLLPVPAGSSEACSALGEKVRHLYRIDGPLTYLYVDLLDDRSDFYEQLTVKISQEGKGYKIVVQGANVVANTIAYVSTVLRARNVILHLSKGTSPLNQAFRYFIFGTGETGLMVYEILVQYWKVKPEADRPILFLMTA